MRVLLGFALAMLPVAALAGSDGSGAHFNAFYCVGPSGGTGVACNRQAGPFGDSGGGVPQTGCILVDVGVCMLADTGVKILVQ